MDVLLLILVGTLFLSNSIYSALAPFFPRMSKTHGLGPTSDGLIFSGYPLFALLSAPLIGVLIQKIGRANVLFYSTFLIGLSTLGFALLPFLYGDTLLIVAFITRAIQGVGGAGILNSSFAIIACTYVDNMEEIIGI